MGVPFVNASRATLKFACYFFPMRGGRYTIEHIEFIAYIAASLRRARLAKNYTYEALGEMSGVSFTLLYRIEEGMKGASLATLYAVSRALEMKIDDFTPPLPRPKKYKPSAYYKARMQKETKIPFRSQVARGRAA